MSDMNFDILKQNVRDLMDENNLTQEQLGKKINMSQSNVNKCLKFGDGSRNFTLEQVWKIADLFDTTVDELLGRQNDSKSYPAAEICRFLASLIQKYQIVHFDHEVEEEVWTPSPSGYDCDISKTPVTYDAFYFPNYVTPPKYFDEFRLSELEDEARVYGSALSQNMSINAFLQKFIDAFEKYDSGVHDEDDFNILVDAYYRILNK